MEKDGDEGGVPPGTSQFFHVCSINLISIFSINSFTSSYFLKGIEWIEVLATCGSLSSHFLDMRPFAAVVNLRSDKTKKNIQTNFIK